MKKTFSAALRPLIFAACATAVGFGCAHYSQEEGERLAHEVYALSTQLQALQKSVNEIHKTQESTSSRFGEVAGRVDDLDRAARQNDADLGVQLDQVREEIARARGVGERLEALETTLNKVTDNLQLIDDQRKTQDKTEDERKAQVEDEIRKERLYANPSALVDEVVHLLNAQKPGDARKLLREFQKRAEGNSDLTKYRDDVQFLIAETYFIEGNYQLAASEYNVVRKTYPQSDKVPESLYKLGMCFEKLKYKDDAKLFYQTVKSQYKKSPAAKKAEERLKALR